MHILVTGGAGYLGSTVVPMLLDRGYQVTVYDSLLMGGDAMIPFFTRRNFKFIKGDVRDKEALKSACAGKDFVVHLAAIVGFPACDKDPHLAEQTNFGGAFNLVRSADNLRTIYASSVSVYGKVLDKLCTEDIEAKPLSLYGETKLRAEALLLKANPTVALRFPTLFGLSPRMRLDLMVNDLTYQAVKNRYSVIYEAQARRTFLHVRDAARAILFSIDNFERMSGKVYNPGSEKLNITKADLCKLISRHTKADFFFAEVGKDLDGRDCEVSFSKIRNLGFEPVYSLEYGIKEMVPAMKVMSVKNQYLNV